jgi:hypothetical protein
MRKKLLAIIRRIDAFCDGSFILLMKTGERNRYRLRGNGSLSLLVAFLLACSSIAGDTKTSKVLRGIDGEPVVPRQANRILIPSFRNNTREPAVSERLTIRLRELITMDGRLAVVSDEESADLKLKGAVLLYHLQPIHFSDSGEAVRKRLRIVVSVELIDVKSGREIFRETQVQAFRLFSEVIPPIISETQVRNNVVEELARRVAVTTITGWYTGLMTDVEKGKR